MKKVYFSCSISGGREYAHMHQEIVSYIKAAGLHVLSEIFADKTIKPEHGPSRNFTPEQTWEADVAWVREADAVIAEVTQPSLGVGYELGLAETSGTPILALFYVPSGRRLSPMISGNPNIEVMEYGHVRETEATIKEFLQNLPV